jgi:hypothetical protein
MILWKNTVSKPKNYGMIPAHPKENQRKRNALGIIGKQVEILYKEK